MEYEKSPEYLGPWEKGLSYVGTVVIGVGIPALNFYLKRPNSLEDYALISFITLATIGIGHHFGRIIGILIDDRKQPYGE